MLERTSDSVLDHFLRKFWFGRSCRTLYFVRPSDTQKLRLIRKPSALFSLFLPFCLGRNSSYSLNFTIQIHLFSEQVPRNHSDRHLHIPIASLLRIITSPNRQLHYKSQFLPETLTTKISPSVDSSCIHCSSYCTPHRLILICITLHNKITLHCNHGEN